MLRGLSHDRVVDRPGRRRIGGGVGSARARRPGPRLRSGGDIAPADVDAQPIHAEVSHDIECVCRVAVQQQFVLEDRFELRSDELRWGGLLLVRTAAAGHESEREDGGSDQRSQRARRWLNSEQALEDTCLDLARMLVPVRTGPAAGPGTQTRPRVERLPPEVVFLGVMIVVGAALRFATLATQSYWVDEATTVHDIHGSLGELLCIRCASTRRRHRCTSWWRGCGSKLFGTGEVGLRIAFGDRRHGG